ncbi:tetratricopeptide repeat protein [Sinomicrobium weinanense]|uniref:Tetratricopeptide repeat protein n=1 Tax=Sinomicrobium weinanense TaxID=2842200 RepID=A0A926JVK0_9FLAO|nr:tetratricopeptide repeat protein [Sinomicrobium weinanense]MBC9797961.1 tetratricopeptide repeat protein [Sinomicrobium weinanense]MBU3123103.1 tetratricopeptide repeat protein [Sinomicrobium weinanense]
MKKFLILAIFSSVLTVNGQSDLKKHYEAFYKQMRTQGDINGAINALTHLYVIEPSAARKDTLAYLYANSGQYIQAVNLLGTEKDASASDMAVDVKAISLKSLDQPQLAVQQYEILFDRKPDAHLAYELANLNLQIGKLDEAKKNIAYGLENATDEMKVPFYESKPPYEVPLKAALTYEKGLLTYNEDKSRIDEAIQLIDQAIVLAPNFNLAKQIKQALNNQKKKGGEKKEEEK